MTWIHRPALDGVRTLAIYAVVLFHAGVAAVPGGFIGVDLFFVLSGFLVASVLLDEHRRTGRIRVGRFYARRVRRLMPAALVAIVAISVVFLLVASTVRRLPWIGDAQASLLYVANWRFLAEQTDYFGADVDRSPFLHFWSLAIEEQFYLAFPVVLLALLWLSRRWRFALPWGLGALFVCSVAAQLFWATTDPVHAYYGTGARAYQLLAGVLAAYAWSRYAARGPRSAVASVTPRLVRGTGQVLALSGVVALIALATVEGPSAATRGLGATAASLALIGGLVLHEGQSLARLLGSGVPAYLGSISYATYLWHWPLTLVLVRFVDASTWIVAALVAAGATGLAALSYEVLEQPVRRVEVIVRRPRAAVAASLALSLGLALIVVPGILGVDRRPVLVAADPPGDRVSTSNDRRVPSGIRWFRYADDKGPDDTFCTSDDLTSCVVHEEAGARRVALIGDSHARMLAPVMTKIAEERDFTLSLDVIEACPWQLVGIERPDQERGDCGKHRAELYDSLLSGLDVDTVVLSQLARDRGKYLENSGMTQEQYDLRNLEAMRATVNRFNEQGIAAIIVRPTITIDQSQPNPLECLSRSTRTGPCRVRVDPEPPPSDAFARTLAVSADRAATITVNEAMCPDAPTCEPLIGRVPVWRDRNHYAPAALERRAGPIRAQLEATGYLG